MALKVLSAPEGQQKKLSLATPQPLPSIGIAKPQVQPKLTLATPQAQPKLNVVSSVPQGKITSVGTLDNQQPLKATVRDLGQKIKAKYPGQYDDLSDEDLGAKVKGKFPGSYDDFIDIQQPVKEKSTLGKFAELTGFSKDSYAPIPNPLSIVGGVVKPLATIGASIGRQAQSAPATLRGDFDEANRIAAKPVNLPILGKINTVQGNSNLQNVGLAAEVASYLIPGARGTLPAILDSAPVKASIGGAIQNSVSSLGNYLQNEESPTLGGGFRAAGKGALTGALTAGVAAAAGKLLPANRIISAQQKVVKAGQDLDNLAGQVIQGTADDITKAKKALSSIEVGDIKTYKDLTGALEDQITAVAGKLDEGLQTRGTNLPLEDFAVTKKVGNKTIKHNYVDDALKQLDELYEKTNDPVAKATIEEVSEKARSQGLTIKEVNDLARVYGEEFNSKAFSKISGDPLTSVNAQSFENTRKGIKEAARGLFDNPVYKAADEELSNLIRTRDLVKVMSEKVNQLQQKVQQRGMGEKVGRLIFQIVDKFTGGGLKGFVQSFVPRGEGLKIMNALDLENALSKNLKIIDSILKQDLPEKNIIQKLEEIINAPPLL